MVSEHMNAPCMHPEISGRGWEGGCAARLVHGIADDVAWMQPLRGAGADEHAALLRGELVAAAEQLLGRREEEGVRRCAEVHKRAQRVGERAGAHCIYPLLEVTL